MWTEGSGRTAVSSRAPTPFGFFRNRLLREGAMDLQTAVAVSMLSTSRSRASAVFKDIRQQRPDAPLEALLDALDTREEASVAARARQDATRALEAAVRGGLRPIAWFDAYYPALLNCIPDPPPVLWVRGDPAVLTRPTVAIVGSRAATTYALAVGSRLAEELAAREIVVASGLARGVDSAAHCGCLDACGATVAVLGSGLDRVYPAEHAKLADKISEKGIVISELGPGAPPLPEHFPLRNRIISGISLAVVVVEASENSGSLITARYALEQGRDVMAVPGSVLTGRNRGSHSLLKDGAKVVESADDILDELGWPAIRPPAPDRAHKPLKSNPVMARMAPGEVYQLDELVATTGLTASKLLPRLTELELLGYVTKVGGRWAVTRRW
jgi:DNA processing protein